MATTRDDKTTFGVTITRPLTPEQSAQASAKQTTIPLLRTQPSHTSQFSTADSLTSPKYDSTNPFSAFYQHPESRSHLEVNRKNDVESGLLKPENTNGVPLSTATTASQPKVSIDGRVKECTVWPTKQTLQEKARAAKAKRGGCQAWANLSKKQKLWLKILIGLTVVALAVGLSVGISRAVGGGVWAGTGESHTIPKDGD